MKYWIKAYTEILNDPKMGRLSDAMKWQFIEACLLVGMITPANEIGDGYLPSLPDAAYMSHRSEAELLENWHNLEKVGLLSDTEQGWLVVNYVKRQGPSEASERVKLHREREKKLQKSYSNISVTTPEQIRTDTEQNRAELKDSKRDFSADRFHEIQVQVENLTGYQSLPKDVPALEELAAMDNLIEQDLINAVAFFKDNELVAHGARQLLKSIKYHRAARIQENAQASPRNGKQSRGGPSIDELYPVFTADEVKDE